MTGGQNLLAVKAIHESGAEVGIGNSDIGNWESELETEGPPSSSVQMGIAPPKENT